MRLARWGTERRSGIWNGGERQRDHKASLIRPLCYDTSRIGHSQAWWHEIGSVLPEALLLLRVMLSV